MNIYSCAIVGPRATRFKFKYKEENRGCKRIKKRLQEQIIAIYHLGVREFFVGGNIGVDQWAGEILLRLKENGYSDIKIVVVAPHSGYNQNWDNRSKLRLDFLVRHSEKHIVLYESKRWDSYAQRYKYMGEHADCIIAIHDDNVADLDDAGKIVNLARAQEKTIISIHPDSSKISLENWKSDVNCI